MMIGNNKLVLNGASLMQAVQFYLGNAVFKDKDVKVVSYTHGDGLTTFVISVEPDKK